jgi:S1-C subfamily serine protease
MRTGLTQNIQEAGQEQIETKLRTIFLSFAGACSIPLLLWVLFRFNLLGSAPVFNTEIQEPVAKVQSKTGIGTAFLVSPTKLLTARHVVEGMKQGEQVQLIFEKAKNQRNLTATILFIAPVTSGAADSSSNRKEMGYFLDDIAVLEVSTIEDITPLEVGNSDAVTALDEVILIGYPNGDYSITKGNINSDKYQNFDLFKLDAASNPGNSGGPCILKEDNTVTGMLVGGSGGSAQGENIAIKINNIKVLLKSKGIDISK